MKKKSVRTNNIKAISFLSLILITLVLFQNCGKATNNTDGIFNDPSVNSPWSTTYKAWTVIPGSTSPNFYLVGGSNLNGDSHPELLWQVLKANGGYALNDIGLWNATDDGSFGPYQAIAPSGIGPFRLVGAADLFGDGHQEILWQQTADTGSGSNLVHAGEVYYWTLNNDGTYKALVRIVDNDPGLASWRLVGAADLDGDGKAELIWQSTGGDLVYWVLNNGQLQSSKPIAYGASGSLANWLLIGAVDLDGDGKPELLWQSKVDNSICYWILNNGVYVAVKDFGMQPAQGWRLAGAADINSDGHPELLWQNRTDGSIGYWQLQ